MKYKLTILSLIALGVVSGAQAQILSLDEVKEIACAELQKQNFVTDGPCLEEVSLDRETSNRYYLFALDSSGDCAARLVISKRTKQVLSKITCD